MKGQHMRLLLCLSLTVATPALAHGITATEGNQSVAAFDIAAATASAKGRLATFAMHLTGTAGSEKPAAKGALDGAGVAAYVWPISADPATVGFAAGSGILALAVTAHPDFDDTPLFDENADGDPANDGANWHSHWVVLGKDAACAGGFKVIDVAPGVDLPATAPGLPIALDSPGMTPRLNAGDLTLTVPLDGAEGLAFDAVTAALTVSTRAGDPLLCVSDVHDIASGDLSLPGRIEAGD
jgi:hypothetical protein